MMPDRLVRIDPANILDAIQEAIFIIDQEKRVVRANSAAQALVGLPAGEIVGRPCRDVIGCDACRDDCPFAGIMAGGPAQRRFNIGMTGAGGAPPRRICLSSSPLTAGGRIAGLIESIRDVSHIHRLIAELEQMRDGLGEERARIQAILDSMPDGIYTVGSDWRITSINRAAGEIIGVTPAEAVGQFCYKVLASDLCRGACPLKKTLENGQPCRDVEGAIGTGPRSKRLLFSTALLRDQAQSIRGGIEIIRDVEALCSLVGRMPAPGDGSRLSSNDPKILRILNLIQLIKDSDSAVLLTGESGTGKSLLAEEIHRLSQRRDAPFVKVSCAALAESLLESELFGHVKGAFTGAYRDKPGKFEAASGGTVFLDEVGEIPPAVQVKLLRFIQDREFERVGSNTTARVDVRIVAATHRDLPQMIREGRFREDLYYRLAVIPIHMPPLRERTADLPVLVTRLLDRIRRRLGGEAKSLSPAVLEQFTRYHWPGNIRELENVLEHGYACTPGPVITTDSLPAFFQAPVQAPGPGPAGILSADRERTDRQRVLEALRRNDWKIIPAAGELGIDRTTLWRKMKKYGLEKR